MNPDSIKSHYQSLQLPDDADFALARKHYRRLAQRLHPDLPNGDVDQFQRIQSAYDYLRRYQRDNGLLPLQPMPEKVSLAPGQGIRRRAVLPHKFWRRRNVIFLSVAAVTLIWLSTQHSPVPEPPPKPELVGIKPSASREPLKNLKLGDSIADVIDIQGVPDSRLKDSWFYGESRIDFAEGKVIGWQEHPDTPLHLSTHQALMQEPSAPTSK